jgi:transposase
MHELVKEYYGRQLQSTADLRTSACCDPSQMPEWLKPLLARIHPEVVARYYGCGLVSPPLLAGSELATWGWLNETSALPELLELSLTDLSIMRLYRAADVLMKHQTAIESHLFGRVRDLFGLEATVTLYDLTNTYFEGAAAAIPKAKRGHSKEKRSDCPLLTLGMVLDASGFVRRSRMLAGNAVECRTLEGMLHDLDVPAGALVVMDRGIATEANLAWLREHGYRYLVRTKSPNADRRNRHCCHCL